MKKELLDLKPKYSSPRRTEILAAEGEFRMEDVIANEGCIITVTHAGMIKRTPVAEYRAQKRGGKGIIGADTYEEDFIERLFTASTHDYVLFFTTSGQCLAVKVYDIPEGARTTKGKSVSSFLRLPEGEGVAAMMCTKDFDTGYVVMATRQGVVKKTAFKEYESATREGGIRGIRLNEGDSLVGCVETSGYNEIILVSSKGPGRAFPGRPGRWRTGGGRRKCGRARARCRVGRRNRNSLRQ